MKVVKRDNERGIIYTLISGDAKIYVFFTREVFGHESPFASAAIGAMKQMESFGAKAEELSAKFLPDLVATEMRSTAASVFPNVIRPLIDLGRVELFEINKAFAALAEPLAGNDMLYSEYRRAFVAQPAGSRAKWIEGANVSMTSAVLQAGREAYAEIDVALWDFLVKRHNVLAIAYRTGLSANNGKQPSIEDVLAVGPDPQSLDAAALTAMERLEARRQNIDVLREAIRQLLNMAATAMGVSARQALDITMQRAA